ncbi:hypothetical protein V6N13_124818 [Hibiscus sabdariffa]
MFEGAWVNESSNENVPENRTVEEDGRSPVAPDEGKPPTKLYRAEKERVDDWESRKLTEPSLKRTTGYVNDEALRCLERCVIGSTSTICSSEIVKDRLHNLGMRELLVKSLGGKKFLIEFPDEELFNLLKEKNWAILEEVFLEVEIWQRCFRNPSLGTNHLGEKYIKTPVLFSNPGIKLVGFIFGGGKPVAKPTKSGGRRLNQCIKPGIS